MKTYQINPRLQIVLLNLVPLLGVAFLDWSPFALFYAFWLETLAISFINTLAILFAQKSGWSFKNLSRSLSFFIFQVGILLFYLIFIIVFLGLQIDYGKEQSDFLSYLVLANASFRWVVLSLFLIKLAEFIVLYILNKEYKVREPNDFFYRFNARTIVIHVVIVLGFISYTFLKMYINNYVGILAFTSIFVLAKIIFELSTTAINKHN